MNAALLQAMSPTPTEGDIVSTVEGIGEVVGMTQTNENGSLCGYYVVNIPMKGSFEFTRSQMQVVNQ